MLDIGEVVNRSYLASLKGLVNLDPPKKKDPPRFEKLCFENNGFNVLRSELTDLNPLTLQNSFLFTIIMPIE